ncbi:hypothetical protein [Chryseobacterium sp. Bi04]|uniref:hypothetical protein n=1 Tax=Chryseobacterium sp. Bi04 TaxID=2822345 RepID=UPI001D211E37|nr:hypothetical protein [Chryseobacterium sp. Bi04]CAH0194526.1 hypothetical protein SRABI04_01824 [Chryseobacterium sp. Bi04]
MKKKIFILPLFLAVIFYGQTGRVGIDTADPQRTLDVNGNLRIRTLDNKVDNAVYNRILIGDSDGNIDYVPIERFNVDLPSISTIRYATKTVSVPPAKDMNTDFITIGDVSFRYRSREVCTSSVPIVGCTSSYVGGRLQFRFNNTSGLGTYWTSATEVLGNGGKYDRYQAGTTIGVSPVIANDTIGWTAIDYDYNPNQRDVGTVNLILHATNDIYRISMIMNSSLPAVPNLNISQENAKIVFFIERLSDNN